MNQSNDILLEETRCVSYVSIIKIKETGKLFCEIDENEKLFCDLDDFVDNCISKIANYSNGSFENNADSLWNERKSFLKMTSGCSDETGPIANYLFDNLIQREICTYITAKVKLYSIKNIVEVFGTIDETWTPIVYIYKINKTSKYIYIIDNVLYSEHFPLKWALNAMVMEIEKYETRILGPGTSPLHCRNCNFFGSFQGVFIGYCGNCAIEYCGKRGNGFIEQGIEYNGNEEGAVKKTSGYLAGIDLTNIGYNFHPEEQYNNCLAGGALPTGPDVCEYPEKCNPIVDNAIDDYVALGNYESVVSKKYLRRAYSNPKPLARNVILQAQQNEFINPETIRAKLEIFFEINDIEITNNNYSFPVGPRPEWDHYRITHIPNAWYAWNAILRTNRKCDDAKVEIRLYLTNVHSHEHPAQILVECKQVYGRNPKYWPMVHLLRPWLKDEISSNSLIIELPPSSGLFIGQHTLYGQQSIDNDISPLDNHAESDEDLLFQIGGMF